MLMPGSHAFVLHSLQPLQRLGVTSTHADMLCVMQH